MCCVDKDKDMRELADKVHEYTQFRDDLRKLRDEMREFAKRRPWEERVNTNSWATKIDKLLEKAQ